MENVEASFVLQIEIDVRDGEKKIDQFDSIDTSFARRSKRQRISKCSFLSPFSPVDGNRLGRNQFRLIASFFQFFDQSPNRRMTSTVRQFIETRKLTRHARIR